MRTRPFRFFFGLTIGIMAFFFLAKVFFFAFIVAGIMSLIYHFFRGIKYSFMDLENRSYNKRRHYKEARYAFEPSVDRRSFSEDFDTAFRARRERIIEVL